MRGILIFGVRIKQTGKKFMKKIFLFTAILLSGCLNAFTFHTWDETPENGEMYMTIHRISGLSIPERQTIFITEWNGTKLPIDIHGWWELHPSDLDGLMFSPTKVVYLPNGEESLKNLKIVLDSIYIQENSKYFTDILDEK